MATEKDLENAKSQAIAQFHSIVEMVSALRKAEETDDNTAQEEARRAIEEDALSVEVRTGWFSPGDVKGAAVEEFRILLCTGGPAVQIVGTLSEHNEPETARLQFQDWFTPWTDWNPGNGQNVEAILLAYAQVFYFGEG